MINSLKFLIVMQNEKTWSNNTLIQKYIKYKDILELPKKLLHKLKCKKNALNF